MRCLVVGAALLASASAWAEPPPASSKAPLFGRITISLNGAAKPIVRQRRTSVDVTIKGGEDIATPDMVPRNVISFVGGHGTAAFKIVPGSLISSRREGNTLIIDVPDPSQRPKGAEFTAEARPNPSKPTVVTSPKMANVVTAAEPPKAATMSPEPIPLKAVVPQPAPASESLARTQATPEPSVPPAAPPSQSFETARAEVSEPPPAASRPLLKGFTISASPDVGLAAFRRGSMGVVVFDDPITLDDADGDRTITPTVQQIQRGTLMTLPLADDETLAVSRTETNVTVTIAASTGTPAFATAVPAGIQYKFNRPGRVMAVNDPISGQTMLIGTTRQVSGEQARIETPRSAPGYVVLPTWLGIVVEISSENIDLKVSVSGYTLLIADKASTTATAAAQPENRFNLPVAPTAALVRQLSAQMASAAAAPPRGRGPERVAAARTMLALGMSAEAEALLNLAATDDPNVARDPSTAALTGVAAVLAGRPNEATGLDNPALTGGDIALWRGLRDVAAGRSAPALAGAWPLLSAYPESIKRQIAPPVFEAAAENGAEIPAQEIEGSDFALARALKLSRDGQIGPALAAFDAVKDSRDERASVRAAVAAAELRLRTGASSPAETAEVLERQTLRWRGGVEELALRRRVAELRTQAGQWRAALDGLAQTETIFPASKDQLRELKAGVFRALLSRASSSIAPLDVVAVAGDFAEIAPSGPDGDRLAGLLAEKLIALDLPQRAIPVLKTLIDKSPSSLARAEYGLRLAQMQIDAADPAAAEALLTEMDLTNAPVDREEQRTMLLARAKAARGDFAGAATVLLTLNSPAANDLRANFYARAGDWQRSLDTLDAMAASALPEAGPLNDQQQELLLRQVTAAVQAGNGLALKRLAKFEGRLTSPRADLFRVLTATDVRGPEDLPRAARELTVSRTFPDRLNALKK